MLNVGNKPLKVRWPLALKALLHRLVLLLKRVASSRSFLPSLKTTLHLLHPTQHHPSPPASSSSTHLVQHWLAVSNVSSSVSALTSSSAESAMTSSSSSSSSLWKNPAILIRALPFAPPSSRSCLARQNGLEQWYTLLRP